MNFNKFEMPKDFTDHKIEDIMISCDDNGHVIVSISLDNEKQISIEATHNTEFKLKFFQ
jgi:hypothetical protein